MCAVAVNVWFKRSTGIYPSVQTSTELNYKLWPNFYHIYNTTWFAKVVSLSKNLWQLKHTIKESIYYNYIYDKFIEMAWLESTLKCGLQVLPCHMAKQVTSLSCPKHASNAEACGHFLRMNFNMCLFHAGGGVRSDFGKQICSFSIGAFGEGNRDLLILGWLYLVLLRKQSSSTPLAA